MSRKPLPVQKRLLASEVVKHYKRKGVKAITGSWHEKIDGQECGCAIDTRFKTKAELDKRARVTGSELVDRAVQQGFSRAYINAYIDGFDNASRCLNTQEGRQGYADGKSCNRLVGKHNLFVYV